MRERSGPSCVTPCLRCYSQVDDAIGAVHVGCDDLGHAVDEHAGRADEEDELLLVQRADVAQVRDLLSVHAEAREVVEEDVPQRVGVREQVVELVGGDLGEGLVAARGRARGEEKSRVATSESTSITR